MKINNTSVKKQINEDLKIISGLYDYEPWSGAVDTWKKIVDADMVDALDYYLEDIYPDGLTKTELNDILWFDGEEVLRDLGIAEETEDDDEDYKEELSYADDYGVQKRHSIKEDIDDWRVGQTVFADGYDYKIVNTLDVKDVDGYELAVVALLPEDISDPRIDDPDFQYAVMLDDALEWGLCDTYDEAKEWYDGVNDGYYGDGSEYEDDTDWESYWEGELDESLKLTEDKVLVSDEFIKKRDALAEYAEIDGKEVKYDKDMDLFILPDGRAYFVYTESEADAKAKEEIMSLIDELGIEAFTPDFRQDIIDNQMVDVEWFDDAMRESYEAYADNIKDEKGEHGNRLFDEMIEEGIISETDVTEDGKLVDGIDLDKKREEFVEKLCEGWDNGIEWYITNFGESDFSKTCKEHDLFDYDAIADMAIRWDGRGHFISYYDGDEIYLDNDIFAYKYEEGWDYDKADDMVAESLTEDTVKTKDGKWANVGKDGKVDSGKFKTKKEADAQRKAIFASGWKGK